MATPTASAETSARVEEETRPHQAKLSLFLYLSVRLSAEAHRLVIKSRVEVTCDAAVFGAGLRANRYGNGAAFVPGHRTRGSGLRRSGAAASSLMSFHLVRQYRGLVRCRYTLLILRYRVLSPLSLDIFTH